MMKRLHGKTLSVLAQTVPWGVVALCALLGLQPVQAETEPSAAVPLNEVEQSATTVDEWAAQIAQAELVEITNVQITETPTGFTLQLETSGELSMPETSTTGNATVADIPNAVLNLPGGNEYTISNPAEGIALINVSALPNNQVRIAITGIDAPPTIAISTAATGLMVTAMPGSPTAQTPEDDSIQIVVTGENEEDYFVPNANTATRTDTPILDIPASIQVIPQQVLADQQVTRLDEALNNISGVNFGGTFVGTSLNFNIRGFDAPTLRNGFREFGGFTGISPSITNIERVEVLKGPASILYGEIQPGGVINLVTEQPLTEPVYEIGGQVGNRGVFQPQIDFTGPLTADRRLLYRLNASYFRDDGFTNFEQDFERFFVAPILTWQISDRTELTLSVEYTNERLPFETGLVASGTGVVEVPFDRIIAEPDNFTDSDLLRLGYELAHQFNDRWQVRNAFDYSSRNLFDIGVIPLDFNEATGIVTRFPSQQTLDTDNFALQTTVIGEFMTGSIGHTFLVGVDLNRTYDREIVGFDLFTPSFLDIFNPIYGLAPIDGDNLPLFSDTTIQTNRLGVYLQDQIEFFEGLILLAGIRYDTVSQETTNNPIPAVPIRSQTTQNNDAWTPRFGIVYQPVDELALFASYSQSFTPNIATTAAGDPLAPERGEGFEVGVKAELLNGNLLATLAYFDITRQNVATTDPLNPRGSVATGEQRSRGVELDIVGEILPGWNLIASYAYVNAEVTADNTIAEGNRLFNTPEHSASLWTTYEIQGGDLQGLGFGLGVNFVGQRQGDLANTFELDSYLLTNAAIYYRRDNWRFALNAKNLFDINYIAASNNSRTSGLEPGAPFTLIGSIVVEF
ncbi:MAG: TonB-dependent siderophore receptor [Cyanobacteria bacterium J06635_15]